MKAKKKIAAICGSTRKTSSNMSLLKAIASITDQDFQMEIYSGLDLIPHFNPDLDNESPPVQVLNFRKFLREADAILICTPEYAMGVPGTLKNAIDWTVSSCEFSHKPVALITASSQGYKGHQALLETLKIIESDISEETQLIVSFVKTKINIAENKITDKETEKDIIRLMHALKHHMK